MSARYFRVTVEAVLVVKSPLLIGAARQDYSYNVEPCLNANGNPYLPGASVKGSVQAHTSTDDDLRWIFGAAASHENMDETGSNQQTSLAGRVQFLDAQLIPSATPWQSSRIRNSIDPITGAARDGFLYEEQAVAKKQKFQIRLQLDKATAEELRQLQGALESWGDSRVTLGKNSRNSDGCFSLQTGSVKVTGVAEEDMLSWLQQTPGANADATLPPQAKTLTPGPAISPNTSDEDLWTSIEVRLHPISPVFIRGNTRSVKDPISNSKVEHGEPRMDGKNQIIPPTSFRGALRNRGRYILSTLNQHLHRDDLVKSEEKIARLFGGERQASALRLSTLTANGTELSPQNFIAIDRFTGGVANQKNYNIMRPHSPEFGGKIELQKSLLDEARGNGAKAETAQASLALLLFILRDLMEGEIHLGGMKAKGFGKVAATLTPPEGRDCDNWEDFIAEFERTTELSITDLQKSFTNQMIEGETA